MNIYDITNDVLCCVINKLLVMNDYEFLFKFIMIGDSSTSYPMQTLEKAVFSSDSWRAALRISTNRPLELNLDPRSSTSRIERSSCRYGIPLGKNPLKPSLAPTIRAQLLPYSSSTLPPKPPSSTWVIGWTNSKHILTSGWEWPWSAIKQTWLPKEKFLRSKSKSFSNNTP